MRLSVLGIKGSDSIEQVVNVIKGMSQEEALAAISTTNLTELQKTRALVMAKVCETDAEAGDILTKYAEANSAATASETAKQAATDGTTAANTAQAASEAAKQASVDGTTAANAAETVSETAKTTSGLEGFATNVAEAGSETTKQAAVDGTTAANAAETLSEEAKNASGLEGVATNIAEAASEATEAAATDASAVANAAEAVTEQAKAVAGAESTVVNDAQAVSEGAAANATRDHAAANFAEAASEKAKQGVQKKGILVTSKLGTALKGLLTNKYTWIVAGIAAVTAGIVALYKHFNPSKETLGKNLDEAKQKVQESTQKIEEMESELTNVRDRIAELKGMGSLTIVQQKELDNLEKSGAQLERNIELEKEYRRLKKKDANKAFLDWFDKDMHDKKEYTYATADKSDGANSGFRKIANFFAPIIDAQNRAEQNNGAPIIAELEGKPGAHLVFSSDDETSEIENQFEKAKKLIAQKNQEITLEQKEQIDSQLEEIEQYFLDKTKEFEDTLGDKEADLTWTPNAVAGTDEAKMNDTIIYMDELRDQATLLKGEIHNDIAGAYEDIVGANLQSDRFSEAAKEIEKLKTAEDGTAKSAKKFRKDLYDLLKTAKDGSNIKQLADYLTELGMIDISKGEKGITDLSEAIVQTTAKTDKATQSNLLFADSFSKMSAARKAFEEGLQNIETGTEDYESYAESYEKAMELLNKGYDLDNGVLMAHVERLMSDEQLQKLGYDADKVKKFLQEHLKGVFGDKDTNEPGNGLIDKIKKYAGENGKIYAKGKDGKPNKKRELASYKDGKWHISDDSKDIEELGKQFGMTTDEILACVKAMKTFSDVNLNDTDTITGAVLAPLRYTVHGVEPLRHTL